MEKSCSDLIVARISKELNRMEALVLAKWNDWYLKTIG